MKRFKRTVSLMTLLALLCASTCAFAEESAFRDTFESALYGGAVGALVGAALMVFTQKPADHLDQYWLRCSCRCPGRHGLWCRQVVKSAGLL